jgi:hypothetical protein
MLMLKAQGLAPNAFGFELLAKNLFKYLFLENARAAGNRLY